MLEWLKEFQAFVIAIGVGIAYSFRAYLLARKDIRTDKEGATTANAYERIINELQDEITRLRQSRIETEAESERLRLLAISYAEQVRELLRQIKQLESFRSDDQ